MYYTLDNIRSEKGRLKQQIKILTKEKDILDDLSSNRERLTSDIKNYYHKYVDGIVDQALEDVHISKLPEARKIRPKISFNENSYDKNTLMSLYRLKQYDLLRDEIDNLKQQNHNIYNEKFNADPIFNVFWMFMGKGKKSKAIDAANAIDQFVESTFEKDVQSVKDKIFTLPDFDTVLSDFKKDRPYYLEKLKKLSYADLYTDNDPIQPDFVKVREMTKTLSVLEDNMNKAIQSSHTFEDEVKNKAHLLQNEEAMKLLSTISVDELKKYKKGFRINSLKENGIRTIKDVLNADIIGLKQIYGISQNMAYDMDNIANKIKQDTRQNIRLKLNADNKTERSTQLLYAVYRYDKNKEAIEKARELKTEYNEKIKKAHDYCLKNGNALTWITSDKQKKDAIFNYSDILLSEQTDNYFKRANPFFHKSTFTNKTYVTNKMIWTYFEENSARIFAILDDLCPGLIGNQDTYYGLPEELAKQVEEQDFFPDGLLVDLRRYQEWGVKYILHQGKVLLGDEMGLGKTIQAIATMVSLRNVGADHFLVVCPAAVLTNWCREIKKHSRLHAIEIHGPSKQKAISEWWSHGGVGVTTYETTKFFKMDDQTIFDLLVVDEAHYIKNPAAKRTLNVIELGKHAKRELYLTGTALENKVDEMVELIGQLNPYVSYSVSDLTYLSDAQAFREKVAPVYYRRKREDVLTELPEKIEVDAWCTMTKEERSIYENLLLNRSKYPQLRQLSWNVGDLKKSSKAERLKMIVNEAKDDGRKIIVFSFFLDVIEAIRSFLGPICLQPITGNVSSDNRQRIIDQFEKAPAGTVLIGQISAAGTGLNIQTASVVVIAEPQFKPSDENQAIARAYRMGQTRKVLVYHLLCQNSIDERIKDMLDEKQKQFDAFADKSVAAEVEIKNKDAKNILQKEIDRITMEQKNEG